MGRVVAAPGSYSQVPVCIASGRHPTESLKIQRLREFAAPGRTLLSSVRQVHDRSLAK
jgi:hypothetical protein